nr:hypothetical protein [Tanacetum cinerariifolium]
MEWRLKIGEEVVACNLYLGLAFIVPTLERVIIGCCKVGGGGGGGVGVVCGDGVDSRFGGVVSRRSAMGEVSRLSSKNWIGEEVVTCNLYLGLAFTVPTLERVLIGCCKVGGGGGGVGIVCGDGVDSRVGGFSWSHGAKGKDSFVKYDMTRNYDFVGVQVKAPISTMIVSVPEKDRWCGMRGKFVRWKGVRVTKASKHAKHHQGDEDDDAKENGY